MVAWKVSPLLDDDLSVIDTYEWHISILYRILGDLLRFTRNNDSFCLLWNRQSRFLFLWLCIQLTTVLHSGWLNRFVNFDSGLNGDLSRRCLAHTRLCSSIRRLSLLESDQLTTIFLFLLRQIDRLFVGRLQERPDLLAQDLSCQLLLQLLWKSLAFDGRLLEDEWLGQILIEIFNDWLFLYHQACNILVRFNVSWGHLRLLSSNGEFLTAISVSNLFQGVNFLRFAISWVKGIILIIIIKFKRIFLVLLAIFFVIIVLTRLLLLDEVNNLSRLLPSKVGLDY